MHWNYFKYDVPKLKPVVNYLHYGDALEYFLKTNFESFTDEMVFLSDLIHFLSKKKQPNDYVVSILDNNIDKSSRLNVKQFKNDINRTSDLRRYFNALNCRGFSYKLLTDFEFPDRLSGHVDLYYIPYSG